MSSSTLTIAIIPTHASAGRDTRKGDRAPVLSRHAGVSDADDSSLAVACTGSNAGRLFDSSAESAAHGLRYLERNLSPIALLASTLLRYRSTWSDLLRYRHGKS